MEAPGEKLRISARNGPLSTKATKKVLAASKTFVHLRVLGGYEFSRRLLETTILIRRRSHSLPSFHRPASAAKRDRINGSDHPKPRRQADPRRDPAHRQPQRHLQKRAKEIESVLD